MSRITSPARHRADVAGNIALQGLAHSAKSNAKSVGRPVAIVAITSGLAFSAMGTANAGTYTAPAAAQGATHTVVAGDTLGRIAAVHGVSLSAVLAANGLSTASVIYPGNTIAIPTAGAAVAAPVRTVAAPAAAVAPVQTVSVPVAASAAPVQHAAAVAPARAAASTAPGSGIYLASVAPVAATPAPAAPVVAAPAGNAAGILLGSARAQLAAGAVQDCTVLVEKALRAAGKTVGDIGPSGFFAYGTRVASPAPGDIVITGGHVAIYSGNGMVISSGMNGANRTMEHPLSDLPGASFVRVG